MPRYFFNSANGDADHDREGIELPNHAAARVHAIRYAGMVLGGEPEVLWDGREFRVEVTDERGARLFTIRASAENEPGVAGY